MSERFLPAVEMTIIMLKKIWVILILFAGLALATPVLADATSTPATPVLMYHYVRDYNRPNDKIGMNLSISPANFHKQLDLIEKLGYTPTTFKAIKDGTAPAKPIILTFDDGYRDFYTNVYPELKARQIPAVTFLIYNALDKKNYLTKDMVREMLASGLVEVGSHTLNHPDLPYIRSAKALREITDSKIFLERDFNINIITFCYPYGQINKQVVADVAEAGYTYALTTKHGLADWRQPLIMDRYRVDNRTNLASQLKQHEIKAAKIKTRYQ